MNALETILSWLDGKKTIIGTLALTINTYLMATGSISNELGSMIATIIVTLTGAAVYGTNKVLGKASRQK